MITADDYVGMSSAHIEMSWAANIMIPIRGTAGRG